MSDSESESDREGEQFLYDNNTVVYPRRIRRRSKTSLHIMTINNAYYRTIQDRTALRVGFDAWREKDKQEVFCDCCFHGIICSLIMVFIHKTVIENFLSFF